MQIISQFVPLPLADPAQGTPQPKARKPRGRGGKIALRAALIVLAVISIVLSANFFCPIYG